MSETFTFADLFAGIGGMRLAFESVGGSCTLTSEINKKALETYRFQAWSSDNPNHKFVNDVVELGAMLPSKIPQHDVLVAGFPCQPYSIAGLRQGLEDEKGRGQVFLSILEVLRKAKPKAFLLENVKGMLSHDDGRTIDYMLKRLALPNKNGKNTVYTVLSPYVMNSMTHGGVPQNRERVFIIGFRNDIDFSSFQFPEPVVLRDSLRKKLQKTKVDGKYFYDKRFKCFKEVKKAVIREDTAYQWRRVYVRENKSGVCPALTANMGSGGHNVPIVKVANGIRKLTPRECANLQGFGNDFKFPPGMSDSHLYHQFGNSVTVPLIARLAREIQKVIGSA